MNFNKEKVVEILIDNFQYEFNTKQKRNQIVYLLNDKFFKDGYAKFVDVTSEEEVDRGEVSLLIEYNGKLYNLLAFENNYLKINRMRKLKKLNGCL